MRNYQKATILIFLMISGFFIQESTAQLSINHITEEDDFPKKRKKRGEEEKSDDESKGIFFGGNIGAGYSSGLFINLSPTVGYQVNERLRVAAGMDFYYYNISDNLNTFQDKTTSFGPFAYAQYLVFNNVYAHTQYQFVDYTQTFRGREDFKDTENLLYIGAGYSSNSFKRGVGFNVSALYNVLHDSATSIYPDPFVFSIGVIYR